jgi:hypothetical protein
VSNRTRSSVKKSCDRLWSHLVRVRANGRCERCLFTGRLEAHHCYGRGFHRLRFEPRNGVALCHACHRWAEAYPVEFSEWFAFEARRPEDLEFLRGEFRKGLVKRTLADYLELEASLKALIDDEFGSEAA